MSTFCTYLTIYKGNKLPPFYIGYSTVDKIKRGYRGSVSSKRYKQTWKKELSHNPQLFDTKIISLHENKNDAKLREEAIQRHLNVIQNPLYINRAIGHHYDNTGNKHSVETKKLFSVVRKGKPGPNKGKKRPGVGGVKKGNVPWNKGIKGIIKHEEEHKHKISNSVKKHIENNGGIWNKGLKTGPRKTKGLYFWFHNPITNERKKFFENKQPDNWIKGMGKKGIKQ